MYRKKTDYLEMRFHNPNDAQRMWPVIGLMIHAAAYFFVIIGLAVINVLTSPEKLWFFWPMLGWGIGLMSHGRAVLLPLILKYDDRSRSVHSDPHRDDAQPGNGPQGDNRIVQISSGEMERIRQRIEHLEAIVTTEEWDRRHDLSLPLPNEIHNG